MSWLVSKALLEDDTWQYLFGIRIGRRRFIVTWNLS